MGAAGIGFDTAVSADGSTALVGGPYDGEDVGAAWLFTRAAGTWTQQGAKLAPTDEIGPGLFGFGVALSADGTDGARHGALRHSGLGAAWVFTRSGPDWVQEAKLTGSGASGPALFGISAALSSDGNTALIGGAFDALGVGAAWVFTRSGTTWSQQGQKLTGGGSAAAPRRSASGSHSRPTATPRSSAAPPMPTSPAQPGSSRAPARRGRSKARSSRAPARSGRGSSA